MLSDVHCRQGLAQQDPERARIVEAVDVFHRRIVVAIALATHEHFEAMLSQNFLIIVGAILAFPDALLSVKQ